MKSNRKMLISKNQKLCTVLDRIDAAMIDSSKMVVTQKDRQIDPAAVKVEDFDCSLCFRLLWQPTTTPCGHTYCRGCIDRSLVSAVWCLVSGVWCLVSGVWCLVPGARCLVSGVWLRCSS